MGSNPIYDIVDFAISEEKRFQKIYSDAAQKAENKSLVPMLTELANMEKSHEAKLTAFKKGNISKIGSDKVQDLKISDYLVDVEINDDSSIQDIMIYAMKSEKGAHELYTKLSNSCNDSEDKKLFSGLAQEELRHKNNLEKAYEDNFLKEN